MSKIYYYSLNGKLEHEYNLDKSILENLGCFMSRVYLKNGTTTDGYISTEDLRTRNMIKVWIQEYDVVEDWEVNYDDIDKIECLLDSHPMYGHKMMNSFAFEKEDKSPKNNSDKHFYIYVEYIDMLGDRMYCYTSDDETIKKDDYVLVKRNQFEIPAKVINTVYYTDMEAPYPYTKLKRVIKKYPKEYKFYVDDEDDFYDDEDYGFCSYIGVNEKEFIKLELNSFLIGKYEYTIYRATKNGLVKDEEHSYIAGFEDEKFDSLLDKIKENNIDRWDKEYIDNTVLDGESWKLNINTKNIKLKSSGINAYPKNYDTFLNLLEINGVPIDEYYPVEENIENIKERLTEEQIEILDKYNINYNVKTKKELLINIDDVMTDYVDENDEPTEDFKVIEKLYDDIYRGMPSDVTNEEEHEFIKYFNQDVIIVFKDFSTLSGHCETITRKEDSEYSEPELTIASSKGYIEVDYSDVILIVSELDRVKTHDGRVGTVMGIYKNTTGMEVEFDDTAPKTETIDIKNVEEVLTQPKENKRESEFKTNAITRDEFLKINENDVMFITNPGRMGDEDGSTFIIKKGNELIPYRVSGWMYGKDKGKDYVSLDDAKKQFPKWYETWENCNNEQYKGKYQYLYMGFGNGLSVDNSIYEEFKPYLDKAVKKNLAKYKTEDEKKEMKYAAIFNVWENAFVEMINDKKNKE